MSKLQTSYVILCYEVMYRHNEDEEWNKEETTLILYKSAGNWYVMDSFY